MQNEHEWFGVYLAAVTESNPKEKLQVSWPCNTYIVWPVARLRRQCRTWSDPRRRVVAL